MNDDDDHNQQIEPGMATQSGGEEMPVAAPSADAPVSVRLGCRTLKSAPIFWGRKDLIVELRRQRRIGYNGHTLAAVLKRETEEDRLKDPFCRVLDMLRRDLAQMLCRGHVQAYAFVEGCDPRAEQTPIYKGLWRVLKPDFDKRTAEGAGIRLYDVVVCSPSTEHLDQPVTPSEQATVDQTNPTEQPELSPEMVNEPDPFTLSVRNRTLQQGARSVRLSQALFVLIKLLAERTAAGAGVILNQEINALYSPDTAPGTVRSYISNLRKELEQAGLRGADGSELIQNHHGLGYTLRLASTEVSVE